MLVKDDGTNGATVEVKSDNFTIEEGAVHVISGAATTTLKLTGQVGLVKGNLLVDDKGVLDISAQTTVAEGETEPAGLGTVTLADGSNTVVSGSINVNNGTLIVDDNATLAAAQDGAKINVNATTGGTATQGTLQISSDNLKAYLTGKDGTNDLKYNSITAAGVVGDGDGTGASGAVMLSGGRLELTGDENIDIAKTFMFSGATTAQTGMITLNTSAQSTVYAKNMTLSSKVTKDLATGDAGVGSALVIEAETLTLGSETLATASESSFGFSGAKAQNLVLLAEDGNLNLQDQVTLSAVNVTTNGDETVVVGDDGKMLYGPATTPDGYAIDANGLWHA